MRRFFPPSRLQSRGVTLVEMLGALAVGAMLMVAVVAMQTEADKTKLGVYLQRQQKLVADAAAAYVNANWQTLSDRISATTTNEKVLRVAVADIAMAGYLPTGWQAVNAFGQTQCLLVAQNGATPSGLSALLVTGGGRAIPNDLLWPAAVLSGHGAGVIQTTSSGLEAIGVRAQWRIGLAVGELFGTTDCAGEPLAAGRLATLLTLVPPQQTGTSQAIVRSGATRLEEVTVAGTMTLNRTVVSGAGSTTVAGDTCTAAQRGSITATTAGDVLACGMSGGLYKWLQTGGASSLNGFDAERLRLRQFTKLDSACDRLGELGMIEGADGTRDGAMSYCFFNSTANALVWKKVGGQWKFVSMADASGLSPAVPVHFNGYWGSQGAIDFQALANKQVPSSARVVQVYLYAQNSTNSSKGGPSTLSVVYFPPGSSSAIEVLRIPPGAAVGSTLLVPNTPMKWQLVPSVASDDSQSEITMIVQGYVDAATD